MADTECFMGIGWSMYISFILMLQGGFVVVVRAVVGLFSINSWEWFVVASYNYYVAINEISIKIISSPSSV